MDDNTLNDLKQFITATMSQQLALFKDEFGNELRTEIKATEERLGKKIDDLSASVAQAMDTYDEATAGQLVNHEKRIVKLEQAAV